jgi:hypothetical protein
MSNLRTPKVKQTSGAKTTSAGSSNYSFTAGNDGVSSKAMKAVGRNLARRNNQRGGKK